MKNLKNIKILKLMNYGMKQKCFFQQMKKFKNNNQHKDLPKHILNNQKYYQNLYEEDKNPKKYINNGKKFQKKKNIEGDNNKNLN